MASEREQQIIDEALAALPKEKEKKLPYHRPYYYL